MLSVVVMFGDVAANVGSAFKFSDASTGARAISVGECSESPDASAKAAIKANATILLVRASCEPEETARVDVVRVFTLLTALTPPSDINGTRNRPKPSQDVKTAQI